MNTKFLIAAFFLLEISFLSISANIQLEPLSVGKGSSAAIQYVREPMSGEGSLKNTYGPLPALDVPVGGGEESNQEKINLGYLIAFETTPEFRKAIASGKKAFLEVHLTSIDGDGAYVHAALLDFTADLSVSQWAAYRAWNVAESYSKIGELSSQSKSGKHSFEVKLPKVLTEMEPLIWFALYSPFEKTRDNGKLRFGGDGDKSPRLIIR